MKTLSRNLWVLQDKNTKELVVDEDAPTKFGKTELGKTMVFLTRREAREAKFGHEKVIKVNVTLDFFGLLEK